MAVQFRLGNMNCDVSEDHASSVFSVEDIAKVRHPITPRNIAVVQMTTLLNSCCIEYIQTSCDVNKICRFVTMAY
jgi:hypothetical protein